MSENAPTSPAEAPAPTVANADRILLPEAAKNFAAWKIEREKAGQTVSPDAVITFNGNLTASGMGWSATNQVVTEIELPQSSRMLTPSQVIEGLDDRASLQRGYKPYRGSSDFLNQVSLLASRGSVPMPLVYTGTTQELGSPAAAQMLQDGTGVLFVDPELVRHNPETVRGAAGHELGHLAQGSVQKFAALLAAAHNDTTGTTQRGAESAADAFAVTLGVGPQLRDLLVKMDKDGKVNPNDRDHPSISDRVAAINTQLAAMNRPTLESQPAEAGPKTPSAVPTNPAAPNAAPRR